MKPLIDETYFTQSPNEIPNLEGRAGIPVGIAPDNVERLKKCIATHGAEYMKRILGVDLFLEYVSSENDPKWDALKAILVDTDVKLSPITNYVYFYYLAENWSSYNGESANTPSKKDNQRQTPLWLLQYISWNAAILQNRVVLNWLLVNRASLEQTNSLDTIGWEILLTEKTYIEGILL